MVKHLVQTALLCGVLMFAGSALAQNKVVVIPMGEDSEKSEAVVQSDGNVTTVPTSNNRYIVEASAAVVGEVQPLDHELFLELCQDLDGCKIIIAMIDWNLSLPGLAASRREHMFYSS